MSPPKTIVLRQRGGTHFEKAPLRSGKQITKCCRGGGGEKTCFPKTRVARRHQSKTGIPGVGGLSQRYDRTKEEPKEPRDAVRFDRTWKGPVVGKRNSNQGAKEDDGRKECQREL